MIFGQNRNEMRKMYADAWQKHCDDLALSPLEAQIAAVIAEHPEYHGAITGDLDQDFGVEGGKTNPFLHMGMHLGIREQVATNRPDGIATIFRNLAQKSGDAHRAEHAMIDCLAETLWEAQKQNHPPDEAQYIERLRRL
ncbi:MAG: DUF1841 family protein [Gammaproteobacteria bacterium]|nr:DUF1841 family protein [Gammaproteobacteria bacterium]MDH3372468.1 DUF1841 family protein [Gammaproteobacteria bacterium]MDH3407904.1 DUF1841 family protein [Gammaproteobacteria bacterium]MDH3551854.1 DUF1841 family protein [Gammaproteobacteria bacterium]